MGMLYFCRSSIRSSEPYLCVIAEACETIGYWFTDLILLTWPCNPSSGSRLGRATVPILRKTLLKCHGHLSEKTASEKLPLHLYSVK